MGRSFQNSGMTNYHNVYMNYNRTCSLAGAGRVLDIVKYASLTDLTYVCRHNPHIRDLVMDMVNDIDNPKYADFIEKLFVIGMCPDKTIISDRLSSISSDVSLELSQTKAVAKLKNMYDRIVGTSSDNELYKMLDPMYARAYMCLTGENTLLTWIIVELTEKKYSKMTDVFKYIQAIIPEFDILSERLYNKGTDIGVGSDLYKETKACVFDTIDRSIARFNNARDQANGGYVYSTYDASINHIIGTLADSMLEHIAFIANMHVDGTDHVRILKSERDSQTQTCRFIVVEDTSDIPKFRNNICEPVITESMLVCIMEEETFLNKLLNPRSLVAMCIDICGEGLSRSEISDIFQGVADMIGVATELEGSEIPYIHATGGEYDFTIYVDRAETRFKLMGMITDRLEEWVKNEG